MSISCLIININAYRIYSNKCPPLPHTLFMGKRWPNAIHNGFKTLKYRIYSNKCPPPPTHTFYGKKVAKCHTQWLQDIEILVYCPHFVRRTSILELNCIAPGAFIRINTVWKIWSKSIRRMDGQMEGQPQNSIRPPGWRVGGNNNHTMLRSVFSRYGF